MKHFSTLYEYCQGIGIPPPKWELFDTRSFRENMKSVYRQMTPFKHEFYAIALKLEGSGYAKTGIFSTEDLKATVFFNSPYQILQWDIAPDWEGYYIIFSEDFYKLKNPKHQLSSDYPFLLIDNTIPLSLSNEEAQTFLKTFQEIHEEYATNEQHSYEIVHHYTHILLRKVSRLFHKQVDNNVLTFEHRDHDIALISRFKNLIETSFYPDKLFENSEPHKVQFYADKLMIHPNHLNAVTKRITSQSASELIYKHLLSLAKSRLKNTEKSVKEIAFDLYYNYPNHFTKFFKKQTGYTPLEYRKS